MSGLWELVQGKPEVDPFSLARAIEIQAESETIDFRTRLLIRDSTEALEKHWGRTRLLEWLNKSPARATIESIQREELGETGFPTLRERLVSKTNPDLILEYLRDLGSAVATPSSLMIGGSIALILQGYISRSTEDIDVVDEVPDAIREQYELLAEMKKRYGIYIAHFQSHYLPSGWKDRLKDQGKFGSINVLLVDAYDILLGKLFSARSKDLDDLRSAKQKLDKQTLIDRLGKYGAHLTAEPLLLSNATRNWYVLFGEELPK